MELFNHTARSLGTFPSTASILNIPFKDSNFLLTVSLTNIEITFSKKPTSAIRHFELFGLCLGEAYLSSRQWAAGM